MECERPQKSRHETLVDYDEMSMEVKEKKQANIKIV